MNNVSFYTQVEMLPDELKKEVEDFIEFLLEKQKKIKPEIHLKKERTPGLAKGLVEMSPDFDEPLDDFKEYMK